ncbi:MAG: alpha/beta hydrolase [Acidobacteriota bacterium]
MPLDPQAKALLELMAASGAPPLGAGSVADARQGIAAFAQLGGEPEPVAHIEDRQIPSPDQAIPVRIYTPEGRGPFPVLVYFHGGGWVLCNLDTHDPLCRSLANAAECVVVSVDYRLAPEHKFPAAAEDCYAATQWVMNNAASINGDAHRVAIGGDSAGGNLSAVVALMARDRGAQAPVFQLLIYPATEHYLADYPSSRENADGYFLTRDDMEWFWNHYLNNEAETDNPYASPLRAASLIGLPAALVITAEFDPLRDEGEFYAARLQESGVATRLVRYDGMIHGFLSMAGVLAQGREGIGLAAGGLRSAFGAKPDSGEAD